MNFWNKKTLNFWIVGIRVTRRKKGKHFKWTEKQNNNSFTNFNVFRNPESNQIEHVMFDISNNELSNDIVNNVTYRLFQSILRPQTNNQSINRTQTDDVFLIDPSNNLLIYETILRPNTNTRNNTR